MATLLLSAAGGAIGGQIGGTVLGISAATIGQAAGAVAGSIIDQRLLGAGSETVVTGRARSLRLQTSTPGAPVPRVWGRMRVPGTLIWSTRFLETVRTTQAGGKATGGQTVQQFSYSISLAIALCEGRISRVGRIWADGKLLDTADLTVRVHDGAPDQAPDPKIEATEAAGTVPAFRGTAYVVFEDLPLGQFGNRIPQFTVEVFRPVERGASGPEAGTPLPDLIRGVALSPGTGEFALDPEPARYVFAEGGSASANIRTPDRRPDIHPALDQLAGELPAVDTVSLVVSWFGDDLRVGRCRVEPRAEADDRVASPEPWSVSGLGVGAARLVGRDAGGRPVYGGTPSDGSIIRAIRELKARGHRVMLYPFLLMDIAEGNGLPDPYGRPEQPPYPWRGRITLDTAPGQPGTTDRTPAAAAEVAAFFGTAQAADFTVGEDSVTYAGPAELTWRRFALHMAALGAAAGGVDAICIASELRGITTIRSGPAEYPAVAELVALAAEVRALLPAARISYAADWSEYFGHQPGDGTGDRLFHLDPFWADANVDFVGIDDYLPLSDWRHEDGHLDAAVSPSVYSLPYLTANMEGGEHWDWFYASDADRAAQIRMPIEDTAHGEDWVFRPKDIRGWWENAHHDRPGGVRLATPTPWVPRSKPVWLTETGCPAVDLGANRPNVFFDPKSSESQLPTGSAGARDDEMQRRYLQAKLAYWAEPANNPDGDWGGPMLPSDRIYVWTWDARPFPDFPVRESVWSDGPSHQLGHWITGRVANASLADVIHEICVDARLSEVDVSRVWDAVSGYEVGETGTARAALQPLMLAYGVDAAETGGAVAFSMRGLSVPEALDPGTLVAGGDPVGDAVRERAPAATLPETVRLAYLEAEGDYRIAAAEARLPDAREAVVAESSVPLALPGSRARRIADRWLSETHAARDRVSLSLPPSRLALAPADVIALPGPGGTEHYRIDRVTEAGAREIEAVRIDRGAYLPSAAPDQRTETAIPPPPGPLTAVLLDLPLAEGGPQDHAPHIAVTADPWPGAATVYRSASGAEFLAVAELRAPAFVGRLATDLPPGAPDLWQRVEAEIEIAADALVSRDRLPVLNGDGAVAVEAAPGAWEIVQIRDATLIGARTHRVGRLLRGRRGTEALAAATIPAGARVVVLDEALLRLETAVDEIGLPRQYRVAPVRRPPSDPDAVAFEAMAAGIGLRPFSPVHLRARALAGGDTAVSWTRRTRIGGDTWEGAEVPLSEETEAYRVTVLAAGAPLRTAETATPAYTYTAADRAADAAQGPLEIRVAQLSLRYGAGPDTGIMLDD